MNIDASMLTEILKYGSTALGGGVIGSILTAWNGWGIEQRRLRRQQRAQLVENWRKMIAMLPDNRAWNPGDPECREIIRSEHFLSLEPHLPKELARNIHNDRTIVVGGDFPRRALNKHVGDLERRWDLV
jgi:hypothetical protein